MAAIFWRGFLWGQLAVQFTCCVTSMIYLLTFWPFEDPLFTKMELMNEIFSLLLLYHMLTFTDWLPSAEHRYLSGWSFAFFTCLNMAMHLTNLLKDQIRSLSIKVKKKLHKKTPRELAAEEKYKREQELEAERKMRDEYIYEGRKSVPLSSIRGPTVSREVAQAARAREAKEARVRKEEAKRQKLTYN